MFKVGPKHCTNCEKPFTTYMAVSDFTRYPDSVVKEFIERRQFSALCNECLLKMILDELKDATASKSQSAGE